MGHREHRRSSPAIVPCAVITVSDTRREETDRSGRFIRRALRRRGHPVVYYRIVKDDPRRIIACLKSLATGGTARVVLLSGGTGVAARDNTYEAVSRLLEKRLEGFGELFRALSFREIGAAAMFSRAVAGTYRGLVIFSMPGSEDAVRLALRRLILPEITHLAGLVGARPG